MQGRSRRGFRGFTWTHGFLESTNRNPSEPTQKFIKPILWTHGLKFLTTPLYFSYVLLIKLCVENASCVIFYARGCQTSSQSIVGNERQVNTALREGLQCIKNSLEMIGHCILGKAYFNSLFCFITSSRTDMFQLRKSSNKFI